MFSWFLIINYTKLFKDSYLNRKQVLQLKHFDVIAFLYLI
jgi:hypothetical protein